MHRPTLSRRNWLQTGCLSLGCLSLLSLPSFASEEKRPQVHFRLTKWKVLHVHDEKLAKELVKTFEDLGCEVKQNSHGDHQDIKYRCPEWRTLSLPTAEQVEKWSQWFQGKGFETEKPK